MQIVFFFIKSTPISFLLFFLLFPQAVFFSNICTLFKITMIALNAIWMCIGDHLVEHGEPLKTQISEENRLYPSNHQ